MLVDCHARRGISTLQEAFQNHDLLRDHPSVKCETTLMRHPCIPSHTMKILLETPNESDMGHINVAQETAVSAICAFFKPFNQRTAFIQKTSTRLLKNSIAMMNAKPYALQQ